MKPVSISTISTHFDTQKTSVGMIVICNDEILVQKDELQGRTIYNTFGSFLYSNDPFEQIMTVQKEQLGTSFKATPHGTMVEYIQKPAPDGRVQLKSHMYTLQLSENQKSSLTLKDNQFWISKKEMENTNAIRQDDKIIFKRLLSNSDMNIVMDVEQMNKWIDAKLLAWGISA